jgi:hypothetical protein
MRQLSSMRRLSSQDAVSFLVQAPIASATPPLAWQLGLVVATVSAVDRQPFAVPENLSSISREQTPAFPNRR